jgi:hypothetical protein
VSKRIICFRVLTLLQTETNTTSTVKQRSRNGVVERELWRDRMAELGGGEKKLNHDKTLQRVSCCVPI